MSEIRATRSFGHPVPEPRPTEGGSSVVSAAVARVVGPREKPQRRDPAPSRTAYRFHRLWLTPAFRLGMRVGVPMALAFAVATGWFAQADNRQALVDTFAELRREFENRPEFMVNLMAIDGASEELSQDIREVAPVDFPISSFDLDLEAMHGQLEELDAVAKVRVHVRAGGILQIDVTERRPAVVWRGPIGLELLDREGHRVSSAKSRLNHPELPLIAGEGGEANVAEALALLDAAKPIAPRIRGLVRIGQRRWNVVLDRDQKILLPEDNAVAALQQVLALDKAQDLLARDFAAVDMRNPRRPTLRLTEDGMAEMRRIKGLELGVSLDD